MERRDFLIRSAITGGGLMTLGLKGSGSFRSTGEGTMPMMTLGRTGEKVSVIGVGGGHWPADPGEVSFTAPAAKSDLMSQ